MDNLNNSLSQLNDFLIHYKTEIDNLKVEFDNENFEKGKPLIEVINILYQNLNCLNLSENDEPFKIVASLICDQILIEQLQKATNELQKQCKVLDVVKIRNTAFQAFDFQTLNILYRQLFDYLTKNELVLHEYEKYPKKLINSTKKEILKLMKVNDKNQIEGFESEEKIYLYKDGKKQMSEYEFFKQIGSFENLEKFGMTFNPVHDFNLLKPKRQENFEKLKSSFVDERDLNNLETNNFELDAFYLAWLKSELKTIENWLSNVYPNGKAKRSPSVSNQIEIGKYKNFVLQEIEKVENNNSESKQQPTKVEILKTELGKYGFFELEKIKALSNEKTIIIIEKIAQNGIPYAVAMFDYLGFISYLEINYFRTQYELIRKVSRWFNSDSEGRAIKGNINSLIIHSTENKDRYTAFKHKEKVSLDYEQLK